MPNPFDDIQIGPKSTNPFDSITTANYPSWGEEQAQTEKPPMNEAAMRGLFATPQPQPQMGVQQINPNITPQTTQQQLAGTGINLPTRGKPSSGFITGVPLTEEMSPVARIGASALNAPAEFANEMVGGLGGVYYAAQGKKPSPFVSATQEEQYHPTVSAAEDVTNFIAKMPLVMGRMAFTGIPGEMVLAFGNKYAQAAEETNSIGKAALSAGISAAGTGLLLNIPGFNTQTVPMELASRALRAVGLTGLAHTIDVASTAIYDPRRAKEMLDVTSEENRKQILTSLLHMGAWESLGAIHGVSRIIGEKKFATEQSSAIREGLFGYGKSPQEEIDSLSKLDLKTKQEQDSRNERVAKLQEKIKREPTAEITPEVTPEVKRDPSEIQSDIDDVVSKIEAIKKRGGEIKPIDIIGEPVSMQQLGFDITPALKGEAQKGMYIADNLGLQQAYEAGMNKAKDILKLDRSATDGDVVRAIGQQIGKLGASVRETAIKILNKVQGIGRELADKIAEILHSVSFGAIEEKPSVPGQTASFMGGADIFNRSKQTQKIAEKRPDVTPEAMQRALDAQAAERQAIIDRGLEGKEKAEAMKGVTPLERLIDLHGTPETSDEAARLTAIISDPNVDPKIRSQAFIKIRDAMKAGVQPDLSESVKQSPKKGVAEAMRAIEAALDGRGMIDEETGAQKLLKPFTSEDPTTVTANVRRDLTAVEKQIGKVFSPSHVQTGSWSFKRMGAVADQYITGVDKMFGNMAAMANASNIQQHLAKVFTDNGITNNRSVWLKYIQKELDGWAIAHAEYANAERLVERNHNATTEANRVRAGEKLDLAEETLKAKLEDVYEKYPDARVMGMADEMASGNHFKAFDDATEGEKKTAKILFEQMKEIKKEMEAVKMPTRDDYGVPHIFTDALGKEAKKAMEEAYKPYTSAFRENGILDPNSIKFKHRAHGSILSVPDAWGMLDSYVPKVTNMIARKWIGNKWVSAAADVESMGYKDLAKLMDRDMKDYVNGAGGRIKWMDELLSKFAQYLTALNVPVTTKHAMKIPLEMADMSPIDNAKGRIAYEKALKEEPWMKDVMDWTVKLSKGTNYLMDVEFGMSEGGKPKTPIGKAADFASHQPIQLVEGGMRGVGFKANLLGNFAKGMDPQHAVADALFRSMMVNFQGVDKPMAMRSSMGQTLMFLQQTVTKIMELNVRRAMDLAKGTGVLVTGKQMQEAEKIRYQQALRHAATLGAIYALGKATDTQLFEWVTETPAFVKAMFVSPIKELVKTLHEEGHEFNANAIWDDMKLRVSSLPAFDSVKSAAEKFGFGSAGFWIALGFPPTAQRLLLKPSKSESEAIGEGAAERVARRQLGLKKESVLESQKEKREKQSMRSLQKKSVKQSERLSMPFSEGRE